LRAGNVVCLVCDRDLTGDGVEVELFGEKTTMPGGPATLALRTGAPLVPVGNYFLRDGRQRIDIQAPLPVERQGRLRDDVRRITQDLAHRFEDLIRAAPEQWLMMQPMWPGEADGR
jgi:phosphatidylinositol dimannoside acyltransferase